MYDIKFQVGQKVWMIDEQTKNVVQTCDICDGIRRISYRNQELTCPKCLGKGSIAVPVKNRNVVKTSKTIKGINISKDKITYSFRGRNYYGETTYYVNQDLLFSTSKEAQKFCDEQNSLNV